MLKVLLVENSADSPLLHEFAGNTALDILRIVYRPESFILLVKEAKPDLIIVHTGSSSEKLIRDINTLNLHDPRPVILYAESGCADTINRAIKAGVSALILDGFKLERLDSIVQIALARFNYQQGLREALEEARAQLEDRKQIDRAKAILIKTQKFSEDQAYHTLRKLAMDRNITLGEMARNVLAMADLLK